MHTEREEQGGKNKFGSYTQKFCLKIVFLFYRLDGREREGREGGREQVRM